MQDSLPLRKPLPRSPGQPGKQARPQAAAMASPCSGDPSTAGLPPCPVAPPGETRGGGRDGGEGVSAASQALRKGERRQPLYPGRGARPGGMDLIPNRSSCCPAALPGVLQPWAPEPGGGSGSASLLRAPSLPLPKTPVLGLDSQKFILIGAGEGQSPTPEVTVPHCLNFDSGH